MTTDNELEQRVYGQICYQIRLNTCNQVCDKVYVQGIHRVSDQVRCNMYDQLEDPIHRQVINQVGNPVRIQMRDVYYQMTNV